MRFLTTVPVIAILLFVAVANASILSQEKSLPASHPEALGERRVLCSECHEDQSKGTLRALTFYSHSQTFIKEHKMYVTGGERLCSVCHAVSFCNDCHAVKLGVKPSQKMGNRPDRELIHRGDFMTRHKIEGKIDPASCYSCHGRANNEKCVSCHR